MGRRNKQKDMLGMKYNTSNGIIEIVDYINRDNITVKFEDGSLGYNKRLSNIKARCVSNEEQRKKRNKAISKKYIGAKLTQINKPEIKGEIIGYQGSKDVAIKLDSGEVYEHMQLSNIRKRYNITIKQGE